MLRASVFVFECFVFETTVAFAVLGDVLSAPRFLVDVFSFVVHAKFEVGVLVL